MAKTRCEASRKLLFSRLPRGEDSVSALALALGPCPLCHEGQEDLQEPRLHGHDREDHDREELLHDHEELQGKAPVLEGQEEVARKALLAP